MGIVKQELRSVCVFCGSSQGARPEYVAAARQMGAALAQRNLTLIYGGGNTGLMGAVADASLEAGGHVIGVIPQHLDDWEVGHRGLTELEIVGSMHERKARMADLADAFIPDAYNNLSKKRGSSGLLPLLAAHWLRRWSCDLSARFCHRT